MAGCGLPDSMTKLLSSFSVFSLLSMYFCIDKQGVSVLVCVCVCVSGRAMKISSSLLLSPLSKRSFRIWFIDAAYVFVFAWNSIYPLKPHSKASDLQHTLLHNYQLTAPPFPSQSSQYGFYSSLATFGDSSSLGDFCLANFCVSPPAATCCCFFFVQLIVFRLAFSHSSSASSFGHLLLAFGVAEIRKQISSV